MENAERKARQLLEVIMENTFDQDRSTTVFDLLNILDPADFVECGYSSELEECLEQYADNMDDEEQMEILRALKIIPQKQAAKGV